MSRKTQNLENIINFRQQVFSHFVQHLMVLLQRGDIRFSIENPYRVRKHDFYGFFDNFDQFREKLAGKFFDSENLEFLYFL